MRKVFFCILLIAATLSVATAKPADVEQKKADEFLAMFNSFYQRIYTVDAEATWVAVTDVTDMHTGAQIGADRTFAAFIGSPYVLATTRDLLKFEQRLNPLTVRQLKAILYTAAHTPGTIPDVVNARIAAEAEQSQVLNSFEFCAEKQDDKCVKPVTPNDIEDVLATSTVVNERKKYWEISKQSGVALKAGLVKLQDLRNRTARESGFHSYFDLEVSDYGMTVAEMMTLMNQFVSATKPIYQQLHTFAKYSLAERYHQPVPKMIPADWLGNRWSQHWPGIVEGVDLDPLVKDKSKEWIVQQAESFYVSLGMPKLPQSFWERSDLYELPADSTRKKNTHASAWHIDLQTDVRSLMSVKPDFEWFGTTHHELGHIYYYLAYSTPDVPLTLRSGANRGFHEAIGDLIKIASRQVPYLKQVGILPADMQVDQNKWLLDEAFDEVVFVPWSAGVMTSWEHDLYEDNLPADQYNKKWWEYVAKYQGVAPPSVRGEEFCDACTKTHINDDPAQYYDYAMAAMIKYQIHDYIARKILHQDPHNCNYYGNKEVGAFLLSILKLGATEDWRKVIKEKTGEEISPRAMVEYFAPAMEYLKKANAGRDSSWE